MKKIEVIPMGNALYDARDEIPLVSMALLFTYDRWQNITVRLFIWTKED